MSHHVLLIKKVPIKTQAHLRADIALGKLIAKLEGEKGPLNCYKGNPDVAAEMISASKIVKSVTVVHVSETACGVWRNGVKS